MLTKESDVQGEMGEFRYVLRALYTSMKIKMLLLLKINRNITDNDNAQLSFTKCKILRVHLHLVAE